MPADIADPITPATFGPIACINKKFCGLASKPTLLETLAAIGTAETPADPIRGLILFLLKIFIVFAINKVDRPHANPEKIKEQLAQLNLLVEDWGGKVQSQDISAKTGLGVEDLLDKVLLEAELLELKANPERNATGTIVEASLDKGRGYLATIFIMDGHPEL